MLSYVDCAKSIVWKGFCHFNSYGENRRILLPQIPSVFFLVPSYVDFGILIVGKDLTSHFTDTFLVCVCRTYWESCQWKFNSIYEFLFSKDFIGRLDHTLESSQEAKLDVIIFNFIEQFVLLLDQLIFTTVQFNFMYKIYFYTVQLNCSEQFVLPLDQSIIIV